MTLKSVRDNDYFDGTANHRAWYVLAYTNDERKEEDLPLLTMSIRYTAGDGDDTVWGFKENDTLNILADSYTSIRSGNNLIIKVDEGSILLVDGRKQPPHIIIGESGSGGSSGGGSTVGTSNSAQI